MRTHMCITINHLPHSCMLASIVCNVLLTVAHAAFIHMFVLTHPLSAACDYRWVFCPSSYHYLKRPLFDLLVMVFCLILLHPIPPILTQQNRTPMPCQGYPVTLFPVRCHTSRLTSPCRAVTKPGSPVLSPKVVVATHILLSPARLLAYPRGEVLVFSSSGLDDPSTCLHLASQPKGSGEAVTSHPPHPCLYFRASQLP